MRSADKALATSIPKGVQLGTSMLIQTGLKMEEWAVLSDTGGLGVQRLFSP